MQFGSPLDKILPEDDTANELESLAVWNQLLAVEYETPAQNGELFGVHGLVQASLFHDGIKADTLKLFIPGYCRVHHC